MAEWDIVVQAEGTANSTVLQKEHPWWVCGPPGGPWLEGCDGGEMLRMRSERW